MIKHADHDQQSYRYVRIVNTHATSVANVEIGTTNSNGAYIKFDLSASGATTGYIGAGNQLVTGAAVADCADPNPNAWGFSAVETVVTDNFSEEASVAMDYISTRDFDNATMNSLLAWMAENQATGEEGAIYYLENNEDNWSAWVSEAVKDRVLEAL